MLEFIIMNIDLVIGFLAALILLGWAIFTKQWTLVKATAYQTMLLAEKLMQTKEGQAKMEYVFKVVWSLTPSWILKFITEEKFRKKLQEWYDAALGILR